VVFKGSRDIFVIDDNSTTNFDSEDDYRQVVETSVTVNSNSPIQDYVHPDDQTRPTFEMTPGFKPFTNLKMSTNFFKFCRIVWKPVLSVKISANAIV